jgi:hypothetical protein
MPAQQATVTIPGTKKKIPRWMLFAGAVLAVIVLWLLTRGASPSAPSTESTDPNADKAAPEPAPMPFPEPVPTTPGAPKKKGGGSSTESTPDYSVPDYGLASPYASALTKLEYATRSTAKEESNPLGKRTQTSTAITPAKELLNLGEKKTTPLGVARNLARGALAGAAAKAVGGGSRLAARLEREGERPAMNDANVAQMKASASQEANRNEKIAREVVVSRRVGGEAA